MHVKYSESIPLKVNKCQRRKVLPVINIEVIAVELKLKWMLKVMSEYLRNRIIT